MRAASPRAGRVKVASVCKAGTTNPPGGVGQNAKPSSCRRHFRIRSDETRRRARAAWRDARAHWTTRHLRRRPPAAKLLLLAPATDNTTREVLPRRSSDRAFGHSLLEAGSARRHHVKHSPSPSATGALTRGVHPRSRKPTQPPRLQNERAGHASALSSCAGADLKHSVGPERFKPRT